MVLNVLAIKKLMATKEMTQTNLSQLSGLSTQSISYIMAKGSCSIRSAGKLANALGVGVEEICIM